MFIATLVRLGVTKGLEACGVDKGDAQVWGWAAWGFTAAATLDVASLLTDGSVCIADGATLAAVDVTTTHAHIHAEIATAKC